MCERDFSQLSLQEKVKEMKSRQENWMRQRSQDSTIKSQISDDYNESRYKPTRISSEMSHQSLNRFSQASEDHSTAGVQETNKRFVHRKHTDAAEVPLPTSVSSVQHQISHLSTHYCENCSALMIEPEHRPMLTIPCGHSVCEKCARRAECSICNQSITSQILNIMLHTVISNHHHQNEVEGRIHQQKEEKDQNTHYKHQKYTDHKEAAEEYRNKLLRCDVLESQEAELLSTIEDIEERLNREQRQVENIEKEKDKIHAQIKECQRKLTMLEKHKEEYKERCSQIKQERDMERRKIHLLRKTLTQLREDINKYRDEQNNGY